jgi:hypothetical protein
MQPDVTLNWSRCVTGGVMKKLLVAGSVVTVFGVMHAIAADVHVRPLAERPFAASNSYPSLLLLLLMIPTALGGAWITFQIFKSSPSLISKIGSLLGWGGFSVACLGGCSYFLNSPYTIQIMSWGGFAWIAGVYVTLTWAKLWEQTRLGETPVQSIQASAELSQPQPDSFCYELFVVERWLCLINELERELSEANESNNEVEQISTSVREVGKEGHNIRLSRGNVVSLMRGQSANRRRTETFWPPRGHHRQGWHQHRRARCTGPASS